jgi:probable rRNA maturation factor
MVILKKKLAGITQATLARFAARAQRAVRLPGAVNVLVTSSDELRQLNRRFRNKNKPTDVLSFPSAIQGHGGDIAISADIAQKNGNSLGHGVAMELKILILHGMLHLAGYDHEIDGGRMALKERQLRSTLHLKEGLIERNISSKSSAGRAKITRTLRKSSFPAGRSK